MDVSSTGKTPVTSGNLHGSSHFGCGHQGLQLGRPMAESLRICQILWKFPCRFQEISASHFSSPKMGSTCYSRVFFCFAHPPGYQLNSSNRTALTGSRDENSKGADRVMPRGHENQTSPAAALFPNSSKAVPNMSEAGDFNGDLNGI